jgi:hypothetical protein
MINTIDERALTTISQSPFLPRTKIQFAWDSTSLGLFKECPRKYQYTMIDGWAPREESIHLRFGGEYHAALEHFDKEMALGIDREAAIFHTILKLVSNIWDWNPDRETKAGHYKNRDTLVSLVVDYLDHFNSDPAQTYLKSDGTPAVELSFRFELDWGPNNDTEMVGGNINVIEHEDGSLEEKPIQPYLLCGHLDRVVSFNDQLLVMDRKTTTTTLGPYYFSQYEPHNQMSLYILAGRIILNTPIRGAIIDAAQIKLEEPNAFARGFTYRTEDQLNEWLIDLRTTLAIAETYAIRDHWPMNDTACNNYGGCRFRSICSKSPSVRDKFLAAEFDKLDEDARWNPLKPR